MKSPKKNVNNNSKIARKNTCNLQEHSQGHLQEHYQKHLGKHLQEHLQELSQELSQEHLWEHLQEYLQELVSLRPYLVRLAIFLSCMEADKA